MSKIISSDIEHYELLKLEIGRVEEMIYARIKSYFEDNKESVSLELNDLSMYENAYTMFVDEYDLSVKERIIVLLAFIREVSPHILDPFLSKNTLYDTPYTEFGGLSKGESRGFVPTVQSALFLLCGVEQSLIFDTMKLFEDNEKLFRNNILNNTSQNNELLINMELSLSKKALHFLIHGHKKKYDYTKEFPAVLLDSDHEWSDLIFSDFTKEHLEELDTWLSHKDELLNDWGMKRSIKHGYKALFYGPPGTGKTLTATLLGKKINKDVYRVDLSQIVSKYIGETEKNLEKVFMQAEEKDWILFFDEADSLFGKRTNVSSSNDKYANQETSYLLQRIDDCDNMIILASNYKDNFDDAFLRRFQSVIYFPLPQKEERLQLWRGGFSKKAIVGSIDFEEIASEYELSGATIMNVIRYASLMAIKRDSFEIDESDIIKGIRREKFKEGKII